MIRIGPVDASNPDLSALIDAHLAHSRDATPETSNHTLTADGLVADGVQMMGAWQGERMVGCGGLKLLSDGSAEVKSVHVRAASRGQGIARQIMLALEHLARNQGLTELVLETGSTKLPEYDAARALYESLGYRYCGPIPGYTADPNSAFLRKPLDPSGQNPQDMAQRSLSSTG